jgi:hypothetical protein
MKDMTKTINWRQEYEDLRREASRTDSRRGHGLALFLSRNDGLAGSLNGAEIACGYANHDRGIGQCNRRALGRASRCDHAFGQHGSVLHGRGRA